MVESTLFSNARCSLPTVMLFAPHTALRLEEVGQALAAETRRLQEAEDRILCVVCLAQERTVTFSRATSWSCAASVVSR